MEKFYKHGKNPGAWNFQGHGKPSKSMKKVSKSLRKFNKYGKFSWKLKRGIRFEYGKASKDKNVSWT